MKTNVHLTLLNHVTFVRTSIFIASSRDSRFVSIRYFEFIYRGNTMTKFSAKIEYVIRVSLQDLNCLSFEGNFEP